MSTSWPVAVAVWAIAVVVALGVYVWCKVRGVFAAKYIELDLEVGIVTLPPSGDRKDHLVLSLDDIESIELKQIIEKDSDGDDVEKHCPTAVYRDADGCRQSAHIVRLLNRVDAVEFAEWFRLQIGNV